MSRQTQSELGACIENDPVTSSCSLFMCQLCTMRVFSMFIHGTVDTHQSLTSVTVELQLKVMIWTIGKCLQKLDSFRLTKLLQVDNDMLVCVPTALVILLAKEDHCPTE